MIKTKLLLPRQQRQQLRIKQTYRQTDRQHSEEVVFSRHFQQRPYPDLVAKVPRLVHSRNEDEADNHCHDMHDRGDRIIDGIDGQLSEAKKMDD